MTTVVRADAKGRLCIRGTEEGVEYLVRSEKHGWWITPVTESRSRPKPRRWSGAELDLARHLSDLAESGLVIEQAPNAKEPVGPCRF